MDTKKVRKQFPILGTKVPSSTGRSNPLRYLDHAASTHAPRPVLERVQEFMENSYANVHRGNHHLSREATDAFEDARTTLLAFIGGDADDDTLLFSQNTTSALDTCAHIMARTPGDTVLTHMEHHSNDLPHRVRGRVHRVDPQGDVATLPQRIARVLSKNKVKLVAITGASNVTGERPDVHAIARLAHEHGAKILVDAAQLFAHVPMDVKDAADPAHLDFVAAAGHKSYAPFGSSFLYGPKALLDAAPPRTPGGGTVLFVGRDEAHYTVAPDRHEGGTPNVVGAVAFAEAARWLDGLGRQDVLDHEEALTAYARKRLADVQGLRAYRVGGDVPRLGVFPFLLDGWGDAELATALDDGWGIATRDGCFCAHPLMVDLLGIAKKDMPGIKKRMLAGDHVPGLVRASLGVYNHEADVDALADALTTLAARRAQAPQAVAVRA